MRPNHEGIAFDSGVEDHYVVEGDGPYYRHTAEAQIRVPRTEEYMETHQCRSGRVKGTTGYNLWRRDGHSDVTLDDETSGGRLCNLVLQRL